MNLNLFANIRLLLCIGLHLVLTTSVQAQLHQHLKSKQPLTILSVNSGANKGFQDSITVAHLGPEHPPIVKTVYGTVPSTPFGAPYMAITRDGRYGFITCHSIGMMGMKVPESRKNMVTVVDLASDDMSVVGVLQLPFPPAMARLHPDGKHNVVVGGPAFVTVAFEDGEVKIKAQAKVDMGIVAFDISSDGTKLIATGLASMQEMKKPQAEQRMNAQVFDLKGVDISPRCVVAESDYGDFDRPFSTTFTPDGSKALILNGFGMPSGELDNVVIVDMTKPEPAVAGIVPQVSDGLESVAVHPSGNYALVACLGEKNGNASCLATIDLTTNPPRLLNHIPLEYFPEGLEFSPDGTQLFVGAMFADQIVVFDAEENGSLKQNPYVIHTGRMPGSMAVSHRFEGRQ